MESNNYNLNVKFENLTQAQKIALEEFFAVWNFIGEKKFTLWTALICDGYSDWNPIISIDGNSPERYMGDIGLRVGKVKFIQEDDSTIDEEMYFLDYLKIENNLKNDKENDDSGK